jgi:hypothetical protein
VLKSYFASTISEKGRIRIRRILLLKKLLTGHCLCVEDPAAPRTADQEQQPSAPRQVKLMHHAHRLHLKGIVLRDEFLLRS